MRESVASAVPGINDPYECALSYRAFLRQSLKVFLEKVQSTLKVDLSTFSTIIEKINPQRRFSPLLFVYYDLLKEGYRKKDVHEIFDALQALKHVKEAEWYRETVSFSTVGDDPWERYVLQEMRETASDGQVIYVFPLVHWKPDEFPPHPLQESIDLIFELDEGLKHEFVAYVSDIKIFAGKILESTTSCRYFGAIYTRLAYPSEAPILFYIRNIVHELSHLHLFALAKNDSLVLNPGDVLYSSPLRKDKRPMIGIFHAAFVLSRMVRVLRKFSTKSKNDQKAAQEMEKNKNLFENSLKTLSEHAHFTTKGKEIFETLKNCAYG